jgi:hypothetical protein
MNIAFSTFLPEHTLFCFWQGLGLLSAPEECCKLNEQWSRKGKFSVAMCNDSFSTEYEWCGQSVACDTMLGESCGKSFPRAQKFDFFFHSKSNACVIQLSQATRTHRHGFHWWLHRKQLQASFRPNALPTSMSSVSVKSMDDRKEVIKYTDHDNQDFSMSVLTWDKKHKDE